MRREELYLADLVDNARAVQEYLAGVARNRWDEDRVLRDAVLYRLFLLGEIASALPEEMRARYPEVAWQQIRAFRNLAAISSGYRHRPGRLARPRRDRSGQARPHPTMGIPGPCPLTNHQQSLLAKRTKIGPDLAVFRQAHG